MTKIHPLAVVDTAAELSEDVEIGPYCLVEAGARIGPRTVLQSHAIVRRWTEIGADNMLLPGAILGGDPQHLAYRGERTWLRVGHHNFFGEYTTMHRGSQPENETVIGDHNYFMAYSHVGHDCRVGNYVVMTNYAGLAGHCQVEDRVLIAAYAGAHQGVRVGTMAMLGAGGLCGQDVMPYIIVQGTPAGPKGLNIIGLQRNGVSPEAQDALHRAYRILFLSKLTLPNAVQRIREQVPDLPEIRLWLAFIERSERGITRRKGT